MQYFAREKLKLYFGIMYFLKSFITDQMDSTIFDSNGAVILSGIILARCLRRLLIAYGVDDHFGFST